MMLYGNLKNMEACHGWRLDMIGISMHRGNRMKGIMKCQIYATFIEHLRVDAEGKSWCFSNYCR